MQPRPGKPPQAVPPGPAAGPDEADEADPGKMADIKAGQAETGTGKYGRAPAKAFKPGEEGAGDATEAALSWVEIELVDEDDVPVPGEPYVIRLADDRVAKGTLDENGWCRLEGIPAGPCRISFPRLDQDAWEHIESVDARPAGEG